MNDYDKTLKTEPHLVYKYKDAGKLKASYIKVYENALEEELNETQKEYIKMTIDNLIYDHTIIIVAHRLSTIVDADIIHVVNEGTLESSGTHKELLDKSKVYQRLYANEKKEI